MPIIHMFNLQGNAVIFNELWAALGRGKAKRKALQDKNAKLKEQLGVDGSKFPSFQT